MTSKYIDIPATVQVIGSIYNNPKILNDDYKYHFEEEDFPNKFHKILFGTMYNLHALGTIQFDINNIEDYLKQRPRLYATYKNNNGSDYLLKVSQNTQLAAFDYYYNRIKKMSLFRAYESINFDLSWLYEPNNILDIKKKEEQEEWLDNTSLEEIADIIDKKILQIKLRHSLENNEVENAGSDALELIERLKKVPDIGYPLFSDMINAVTRGARLSKFYLFSGSQGAGKSRMFIAQACQIGCEERYSNEKGEWIKIGPSEPTLYIATEQQKDEIQTMMLAFVSDVDEERILRGEYFKGEYERVIRAAEILKKSNLYIQTISDFSLQDIENAIKVGVMKYDIKYVLFDYIFASMKILSEISSKANVKGLREDNVLFMIGNRLKDLCNEYKIFIFSGSQLSGDYKNAKVLDQSYLRGAKSLADKIDCGFIMINVNDEDLAMLRPLIDQGYEIPKIKISVYKNRGNKYNNIILWCRDKRGVCKIEPMFATTFNYILVPIDELEIKIKGDKE